MTTNWDEIQNHLWIAMDKLRSDSRLDASEYSKPVLGLLFLRFASERFKKITAEIQTEKPVGYKITEKDYLERGALILPPNTQFDELLKLPEDTNMGQILDEIMAAIEAKNEEMKNTLPRIFTRLSTSSIFTLLKTLDSITFDIEEDVFGKLYEYFLGRFAMAEGQRGGQFFTPTSVVQLIVEIMEPFKGRIFDPACGTGGMLVQSSHFVQKHQGNPKDDIFIYGQEIVEETARLCRMNLAINNLSGDIRVTDSLYGAPHDLWGKFDFVISNPPFNVSGVDKSKLKGENRRYPFGVPQTDNANYLWIQMFYSALNEQGRAGFVMPNSASDAGRSELEIRRQLILEKAVDVVIAVSTHFFFTVTLPFTIWFFDKGKVKTSRANTVLFIDARNIYRQVDKLHREFSLEDIEFIKNIVHLYRGDKIETSHGSLQRIQNTFPYGKYMDVVDLCRVVTIEEIEAQGWSLNPGRYTNVFIPPQGFEEYRLHDVAEINNGFKFKKSDIPAESSEHHESVDETIIYLLKAKDIPDNNGSIDIDSLEKINLKDTSIFALDYIDKKYFVQQNDILIPSVRNADRIPVFFVHNEIAERLILSPSVVKIRVNKATKSTQENEISATPQNVLTFLQSERGQWMMRRFSPSIGNFPRISPSGLARMSIFIPPLPDVKKTDKEELSALSQVISQLEKDILPALKNIERLDNQVESNHKSLAKIADQMKDIVTNLSPPSLAEKIMSNYPMPIALAYRRFLEAQFNAYEQVLRLKDLFEAISFFVYNVVLADALQRLNPNNYVVTNKGARKAYNGYSMSSRMDFVDAILNIAKSNNGEDLFFPELVQSTFVLHLKELQDKFRNQLSHTATSSESQQIKTLKKYQPVVEEILTQLEFLSAYLLIRVPSFRIKKGKLIHRMEIYQGVMPKLEEKENDSLTPILADHDHMVLMDKYDKILDLHPLYQLIANDATQQEMHLCFFKQRKESTRILEGESVQGAFGIKLEGFDDLEEILPKEPRGL